MDTKVFVLKLTEREFDKLQEDMLCLESLDDVKDMLSFLLNCFVVDK